MTSGAQQMRRLVLVGTLVASATIIIAAAASWLLYQRTTELLTENLRQRLLTISITQASNINPEDLDALRQESDAQTPAWSRVVKSLHKAKYSNDDVVFMYIFRKRADDPTQMEFVADADSLDPNANTDSIPGNDVDVNRDGLVEPDGPDKLQWPGQPYPEAQDIPETFAAYSGPTTAAELYTDAYGTVLTGYAPITNASGTVVAVLATDIKADDFFTITRQTLIPFLTFIAFLVLIISLLSLILIFTWKRRAQQLADVDALKSQFLSIATHELRTPITIVRNFTALLLDGTYGQIPESAAVGARQVFERATDMAHSVDTYLNVSRIEQGKISYSFAKTDITPLIRLAVDGLQANAERKKLTLTLTIKPGAESLVGNFDGPKITEVVINLIDNSIKYTPQGAVTVTLERVGRAARLTVKDTGVGMTPKTQANLFKLFSPGEDSKKINPASTGVGLYVSKAHVEAHKGMLTAFSAGSGTGSTFVMQVPVT